MAKPGLCDRPLFYFPGAAFTEASQFVKGGGTAVGGRGIAKSRASCGRIRAEGLYRLLRGALSHSSMSSAQPPPKRCCQAPTTTVSTLPNQESEGVKSKPSAPAAEGSGLAQEAPSLPVSQVLEVAIPTHMTPLYLNVGGVKRVYKCQVEGYSEGPSTSQAAICTHVHHDHLGVRLACPSCTQTFLNPEASQENSYFWITIIW